jgi:DNA-binding XRE family transcriptional regulator
MPPAYHTPGNVRRHCERVGITLETLSREMGVPLDTLRKIDAGSREPLVTTALRLARALGIEVEELFGR